VCGAEKHGPRRPSYWVTECYWMNTGYYWELLGITAFITGDYRVRYCVLLCLLLGATGYYWVILGYWVT
jgi:hypothetical protein